MLQKQIQTDLKTAMLEKNEAVKSVLRVLIGEMNREGKELEDTKVVAAVKKMVENNKIILTSAAASVEAKEQAVLEIKTLEKYLPTQLDEVALKSAIAGIIAEKSYSSLKDMGKIMSDLKTKYAGQYDGAIASKLVKESFNA